MFYKTYSRLNFLHLIINKKKFLYVDFFYILYTLYFNFYIKKVYIIFLIYKFINF